jgi:hypothetical protein
MQAAGGCGTGGRSSGLEHFRNTRGLFEDHARWIFLRKIHWNAVVSVYTNSENAPEAEACDWQGR